MRVNSNNTIHGWRLHVPKTFSKDRLDIGLSSISYYLLCIAVISAFCIPSGMLYSLGVKYYQSGGSPLEKIHPSTYILLVSLFFQLSKTRTTGYWLSALDHGIIYYNIACVFLLLYTIIVLRLPVSTVVDNWISPSLFFMVISEASFSQRRRLANLVYCILLVNFLLGISEGLTGWRAFPLTVVDSAGDGQLLDTSAWQEARATALLGHPLTATLITSAVIVTTFANMMFVKFNRMDFSLFIAALLVIPMFGGRFSIMVAILFLTIMFAKRLYLFFLGKGISFEAFITFVAITFILPLGVALMALSGYFDALLARLSDDNGSASTRWAAVEVLFNTPFFELVFGDFSRGLLGRMVASGTVYGIEIGWIAFALTNGLFITTVFFGLAAKIIPFLRRFSGPDIAWPVAAWLIAISSGTGFSSKSLSVLQFAMVVVAISRARPKVIPPENKGLQK